ncbi:MAG: Threonine--tRNA ligase [Candidatus Heimdallarchaeota archaeon LC_2]|nr:MAG: Threonine--tRNA ligase [Candidatus Heimdallarchaeota archaeon LC_2]
MRLLLLHSDEFEYEPKKKAIKAAEEIEKGLVSVDESLVVFMSVEETDEKNYLEAASQAVDEINKVADELKIKNLVLYPWVHLTSTPSRPDIALKVMKRIESDINKANKYEVVKRAPFGWYKGFTIKVKGHPLSELSREFSPGLKAKKEIVESKAIEAEEAAKHEFYVLLPDESLIKRDEYRFKKKSTFKKFFEYETQKRRISETPPAHVALMQKLEMVDYEPASDSGNLRWYPAGWVFKRLVENHVTETLIDYGAHCVETPIMYDFHHPSLEAYMNRFPARQYTIESGSGSYFLRFAACFGQFLIGSDAIISHKHLPLKLFEMTHYSFRREQRGELSALRRLRTFSMPDIHTLVSDLDMARTEFRNQYEICIQMMDDFEVEYEAVFRFQTDFFEENKQWIIDLVKVIDRPVMIELFDKRYAYFICKFEFNVVDGQGKAAALSTVQIDVENAERFDIKFIDDQGEAQRPYILHTSISGAIERVLYAILEQSAMKIKTGVKPSFPFWLAPIQVRLCPIGDDQIEYSKKLAKSLEKEGIRVDIDDRNERVGRKIRDAEKIWIPYIFVIGNNEVESGLLKARKRDGSEEEFELKKIGKQLSKLSEGFPRQSLAMAKLLSKRPIFYSAN